MLSSKVKFFNAFFCPYAQMAWIAFNEKNIKDIEFYEGLIIDGSSYIVHKDL